MAFIVKLAESQFLMVIRRIAEISKCHPIWHDWINFSIVLKITFKYSNAQVLSSTCALND